MLKMMIGCAIINIMDIRHTVTEVIYLENENQETKCKFGVALWNDEVKPGLPIVIISIDGEESQITLQDVVTLSMVLQTFFEKLSPFMDFENFEKNKIVLRKTDKTGIISLFERYHKHMKETE